MMLLIDETSQIKKVVLQNCMTLDFLTESQRGTCVLLHVEHCIYIPDYEMQMQESLQELDAEVSVIHALQKDFFTQWWESSGSTWHWIAINYAVVAMVLVVFCRSL